MILRNVRKDIQSDLNTSHSLDDSDWNEPDDGDDD